MKTFKFLMPCLLVALAVTGCDTDDLRNDVDELKNRVESLEAQVSTINENMNVLQVLIDGNKTIQSCTYDATTKEYKLVLSDGQELTLYQGEDGVANTPTITIDEDNTWVVNGIDTNVPATGKDAATPQFSVSEDGYWMVDYDGDGAGAAVNVKDAKGENVQAKASNDSGSTQGDTFFSAVEVENGYLKVTLADGNSYSLPIVEDLVAEIVTEDLEGFKDGVLTIGYGAEVKIPVKVTGESYFVTAPAGWIAQLSEPVDNAATITLTAPAQSAAASRAVADNSTDLTLQVNKGALWAIDQIKVEAKRVIKSYYDEWNAGNDILVGQVGDETGDHIVTINKTNFASATLVESDTEITADGLFFIKPGITVSFKKGGLKNSILIGDDPSKRTVVSLNGYMPIKETGKGFIAKNIEFAGTSGLNYIAQTSAVATIDNFILDNCMLEIPAGKNMFNINQSTSCTVKNIVLVNSVIKLPSTTDWPATRFINVTKAALTNERIFIKNNVIYSSVANNAINGNLVFSNDFELSGEITVANNTFVNFLTMSQSAIKGIIKGTINVNNNLIYTDYGKKQTVGFVNALDNSEGTYNIHDNIQYNKQSVEIIVNSFSGTTPSGATNIKLTPETTNPFDGGTFNMETATFVPNSTYAEYGAKFE